MPRLNQGAKGTNVVFRLPEAFHGLGFETVTRGGEPFYIIPWDDLHYIGPFNKPHDAGEQGFLAQEDEIAGLIDEANYQFPSLRLRREDVIYSWAGVRPRTARPGEPAGSPAVMLHDLHRKVPDYYVYTGGLLMTHRTAGRTIAAAVARRTTPSRPATRPVYDARLPPENQNSPPISYDHKHVSVADLGHACTQEQVRTLEDLMFRRVRLGWTERMGTDIAHDVAAAVRAEMGWSPAKAHAEAEAYVARTRYTFGLKT